MSCRLPCVKSALPLVELSVPVKTYSYNSRRTKPPSVLPKAVMERVPAQIDKMTTAAEQSPFFAPFKSFPKDISESVQVRKVVPSYKKPRHF